MNTLPYQLNETLADVHGHVCEHCNASFTHAKSLIAKGRGHEAHECPACGKPVNTRVEMSVFNGKPLIRPDFVDWYGPGNIAMAPKSKKKGGRS